MGFLARAHDTRGTWTGTFKVNETDWDTINASLFGDANGASYAGVGVNAETAFTCAAVYDAVNQISSDVAKLPLNLHKRLDGGGSELYTASKLYRLLKFQPNPEMGSMVFRRTLTAHALTLKGGFAEIERDQLGRPHALWPLDPTAVTLDYRGADKRLVYVVREDGVPDVVLEARDVLHIHGLGADGYCAYPVIEMARQAIGMALAAERFGGTFFGNGSVFGGVLENAPSDDEEQKALRRQIEANHRGPDRAHRFLMLWGEMKYTKLGTDPASAQMTELREQQVEEIARFFNMPAYKLKLTKPGSVSYASIEQNALEYYKGPILNWVTLWEEELNRKLIAPLEATQQFIKHNANAFLRGDIQSRFAALGVAKDRGVINADEWRDLEDMNPQPGGVGKMYLVQEQQIPVDRINDLLDSKITKNETPAPTPAPSGGGGDRAAEAHARAVKAEELAEAARQALAEARERNAALEATQSVTDFDREAARAAQADLVIKVATLEQIARDRQADAERAEAARLAADAERAEAEAATRAALEAKGAAEAKARAAEADAQRQIQEAHARAETAVHEAEQAREVAAAAGQAAVTAEQDKQAAEALVDEARQASGCAQADLLEALARADAATADRERLAAELEAARALTDDLNVERTSAQSERDAAQERVDALSVALEEASGRAAADQQQAAEAEQRAVQTAETLAAIQAERDRASSELDAVRATAEAAEIARLAAEEGARAAYVAAAEAEANSATAKAEADALALQLAERETRQAEALAAALASAEATERARLEAEALARAAEEGARTAHASETAAKAEAERIALQLAAAETRHADTLRAHSDYQAGIIAAHRGLVIYAVGRMTRRECQQARAKQATQAKLRAWLSGFGTLEHEKCVEDMLPVMREHVALVRSEDDPMSVTASFVDQHLADFESQVRTALDADPEDFHAVLDKVLTRWERDRAESVADALLTKEIRHASR